MYLRGDGSDAPARRCATDAAQVHACLQILPQGFGSGTGRILPVIIPGFSNNNNHDDDDDYNNHNNDSNSNNNNKNNR